MKRISLFLEFFMLYEVYKISLMILLVNSEIWPIDTFIKMFHLISLAIVIDDSENIIYNSFFIYNEEVLKWYWKKKKGGGDLNYNLYFIN